MVRELKYLALIIWLLLTVFYGIHLWVLNRTIGLTFTLHAVQQQSNKLILDNQLLENEIAKQSSLKVIEQRANQLGFGKAKVEYIK